MTIPVRSGHGPDVTLHEITPAEFRRRVDELLLVYIAAMRYPDMSVEHRRPTWAEHSTRAGFRGVVALDRHDAVIGLCYGYTGGGHQWWNSEVRRGMTEAQARFWMTSYRELTELHVRPDRQGGGVGERMLRLMLRGTPEDVVLLSTPEGENRAWRLYRRLGFTDALRHHHFAGDARPFAILGRSLPLDPPPR